MPGILTHREGANMTQSRFGDPNMGTATIVSAPDFNAERDCEALKKAVKGFGCNEAGVINILTARSNSQRQEIKRVYQQMYGEDLRNVLISELKGHLEDVMDLRNVLISELKGHLEDVMVGLLDAPEAFDAHELRRAMKGAGTKELALIDVMCSRSNRQVEMLKAAYKKQFGRDLQRDIESEASGDFKRVLLSLCAGGRDENPNVDVEKAKLDAQKLYQAGEKKLGTDEEQFNAILARQSFPQLQQIFHEYRILSKKNFCEVIGSEFSGDIKTAYQAIVMLTTNRQAYFAQVMHDAMKGMGTDDGRLIWAIISRSEIDLEDIKTEFHRMYKDDLSKWISGDTGGKYKTALLALVNGNRR